MKQAAICCTLLLAACSPASNSGDRPSADSAASPAVASSPAAPSAAIPAAAQVLTVNVQGSAPIGATVRVKSIELGTDATIVDVSASYGGTDTGDISLAGEATYLLDPQGNRLMLNPPQENPELCITRGQTMDGKLVFLGAVAPGTTSLKLVFNDNGDGTSIIDPGLTVTIPLTGAAQ